MLVYGTAFTGSRHQDWRFAFACFFVLHRYLRLLFHGLYPIFPYLNICVCAVCSLFFHFGLRLCQPTVPPPLPLCMIDFCLRDRERNRPKKKRISARGKGIRIHGCYDSNEICFLAFFSRCGLLKKEFLYAVCNFLSRFLLIFIYIDITIPFSLYFFFPSLLGDRGKPRAGNGGP